MLTSGAEEEQAAGARLTRTAGLHQVVAEVAQEASHATHSAGAQQQQQQGGGSCAMDVDMDGEGAGGCNDGMDVDDGNAAQGSPGEQGGTRRVQQAQQGDDDSYGYAGGDDYGGQQAGYSDDEGPGGSGPAGRAGRASDGDEAGGSDVDDGCEVGTSLHGQRVQRAASAAAVMMAAGGGPAGCIGRVPRECAAPLSKAGTRSLHACVDAWISC